MAHRLAVHYSSVNQIWHVSAGKIEGLQPTVLYLDPVTVVSAGWSAKLDGGGLNTHSIPIKSAAIG